MTEHIVFWLGPSMEPWNHRTAPDTGIGGSELAAIRLVQGLAQVGFRVTVYADITEPDCGEDVNPRWLNYRAVKWDRDIIPCDLLVSSRTPVIGPACKPRKLAGRPTWLWMHDLHVGADWGNHIGEFFDKIVVLSIFAMQRFVAYYPRVEPSNIIIISNGIIPDLYKSSDHVFGDQHRALLAKSVPLTLTWSSAPDRGLDRVLDLWPHLRKMYPNAELQVFGNIPAWAERATAYGSPDVVAQARQLMDKLRGLGSEEGVWFRGKVGQAELGKAWMSTHLWLYPTSFEETSCITAMEAQAAGVKIACTPIGALPETVPYATMLSVWNPSSEWRDKTLAVVSKLVADEDMCNLTAARDWQVSWSSVTLHWWKAIRKVLDTPRKEQRPCDL